MYLVKGSIGLSFILTLCGLRSAASVACLTPATQFLPFCNTSLPFQLRVKDLIGRLKLDEKLGLTDANNSPIDRLGIPAYSWSNECLHGVKVTGQPKAGKGATVFPQPLAWGATFNEDLIKDIGVAISDESRAISNNGAAGFLNCWSPNMNIYRDARWGRGSETYGEDPVLTSKLVHAIVSGLQGDKKEKFVKISATCKHFTAYSLEAADGQMRFWFNAQVNSTEMEETYLPAFKACVDAGAVSGTEINVPLAFIDKSREFL
jgi:beta-D-xylosidase 4